MINSLKKYLTSWQ